MPRLVRQLWFQVLIAMIAGVARGYLQPGLGEAMKPFGDAFVALVRMIITPIIFCTVVHGIAGMNDLRRVGRVAIKALVYFEVITSLALVIALTAVNLWKPGVGMNIHPAAIDLKAVGTYAAAAREIARGKDLPGFIMGTAVIPFGTPTENILAVKRACLDARTPAAA